MCSLITKWLSHCILALTVCKDYIALARMSMETQSRVVVLFKHGLKLKKIEAHLWKKTEFLFQI